MSRTLMFQKPFPMQHYVTLIILLMVIESLFVSLKAQIIADFSVPDTVFIDQPVSITNLSQGGTTFYWSFCPGSLQNDPTG
jgi:hypothetical protein